MQITGENDVDIMLDEDGQPVSDGNGDAALVSNDDCWLQDIKRKEMRVTGGACLNLCRESMMTSCKWRYSSVSVQSCPRGNI